MNLLNKEGKVKFMSNRWKNYGLWAAIIAFIPLLLDGLKVYDFSIVLPPNFDVLAKALLGIFVLAGIISDPTTESKGYTDDTPADTDTTTMQQ